MDKEFNFVISVGHILTSDKINDIQKLNCIRLVYRYYAFPEIPYTRDEENLLAKIYEREK